ncbi:MAG: SIS domain-containing protein, partial [Burkholderiales bacterium]|nr:SIS domain-containing protein [Burkholderiales bacterium]
MHITQEQIHGFWIARERFFNTTLSTEMPCEFTYNFSDLCKNDILHAIDIYKNVELSAICTVLSVKYKISELYNQIKECINQKHRVYILGCGASARLAVLLRRLWEIENPDLAGRVISVCAGGDVALVHSIEHFEDSTQLGLSQLQQQGFTQDDLLIGLSASGESPFVTACIEYAQSNRYNPWLICNNSLKDILIRNPQHITKLNNVKCLPLDVGAMVLTGSTRLQATSAMQIAVGTALCASSVVDIQNTMELIYSALKNIELSLLENLIKHESNIINKGEFILYQTNDNILGLSLLADITERAPTFNITQFENYTSNHNDGKYSPFYLALSNVDNCKKAWQFLLNQPPICLNWSQYYDTSTQYMDGFDISSNNKRATAIHLPNRQHNENWLSENNKLTITLANEKISFPLKNNNQLANSLIYKYLLNTHSTIMFGILGAFEGNLMLSVTPTNYKLMDRAIRYSKF